MNIKPEKIYGLMDENYYWATVNASAKYSHDKDLQLSFLVKSLKEMPLDDIISFMLRTHQLQNDLYTSHLWCAGYLMNRGYCSSENRFEYFRSWIISCGRETYYNASNNPDSLENKINSEIEYYEFEEFDYATSYAFTNKTSGQDIYAYLGEKYSFQEQRNISFNWNPEAPNTLKLICPNLFEKMWNKNVHNTTTNLLLQLQSSMKKWKK